MDAEEADEVNGIGGVTRGPPRWAMPMEQGRAAVRGGDVAVPRVAVHHAQPLDMRFVDAGRALLVLPDP